jgi:predicted metal-dependent hydrolase
MGFQATWRKRGKEAASFLSDRHRHNMELSKRPKELFKFVAVHEFVHLLKKKHTKRFCDLMNELMPTWKD